MAAGARDQSEKNTDAYELIVNGIKTESDLGQQVALVDFLLGPRVELHGPSVGRRVILHEVGHALA